MASGTGVAYSHYPFATCSANALQSGGKERMPQMPTSFRLTDEARYLLDALQRDTGLKTSAALDQAIRRFAHEQGIERPTAEQLSAWRLQQEAESAQRKAAKQQKTRDEGRA